jgi:transcriptional regulator GlxA family with amidase domain
MAMAEKSELTNVAVLIYNGVQLADLAGAYSVFEAARTFNVYTVAPTEGIIETYLSPVSISPKYTFSNCPKPDILIIPGGGVGRQVRDQRFIEWVEDHGRQSSIVLSVCTGAFILAKTGLIDNLSSTVLEEDIEQLKRAAPKVNVISGKRFVDNGKYLSAAGPTSGIDASLHILTRIFGNDRRAIEIAKFLDYGWSTE